MNNSVKILFFLLLSFNYFAAVIRYFEEIKEINPHPVD